MMPWLTITKTQWTRTLCKTEKGFLTIWMLQNALLFFFLKKNLGVSIFIVLKLGEFDNAQRRGC